MQIRRVTTAEAPVGVITQIDEIFGPSTVETGIDVLDIGASTRFQSCWLARVVRDDEAAGSVNGSRILIS